MIETTFYIDKINTLILMVTFLALTGFFYFLFKKFKISKTKRFFTTVFLLIFILLEFLDYSYTIYPNKPFGPYITTTQDGIKDCQGSLTKWENIKDIYITKPNFGVSSYSGSFENKVFDYNRRINHLNIVLYDINDIKKLKQTIIQKEINYFSNKSLKEKKSTDNEKIKKIFLGTGFIAPDTNDIIKTIEKYYQQYYLEKTN